MEANPETPPIGEDAPEIANAVVEVPAGSRNEYELEGDEEMRGSFRGDPRDNPREFS